MTYPYFAQVLTVKQPIGTYYVAIIPARILLDTCFSDRLRAVRKAGSLGYDLDGTQRSLDSKKVKEIAAYIGRYDAAFPNAIILSANYRDDDGMIEEDETKRWSLDPGNDGIPRLKIPSAKRLAAIIDGQHRLFGFSEAAPTLLDTELICAIFFDLPKPFQAQLFATINSTQKPVSKSQTYELFGYNVEEEPEEFWSPDKLAVFFARKLNGEEGSPFRKHITISADTGELYGTEEGDGSDWRVSMATVVDGILRLISTNPKSDTAYLSSETRKTRAELTANSRPDASPLRSLYIEGNDQILFLLVSNFFKAAASTLWSHAESTSFIIKTVGIQATFDVLRKLAPIAINEADVSVEFFEERLSRGKGVDFSVEGFRNASGSGRTRIRRVLEVITNLSPIDSLDPGDQDFLAAAMTQPPG